MKVKSVVVGFHGADLFSGWDSDGYDVAGSAAQYAKLLQERLEKKFPDAAIEVKYDLDAIGVLPSNLQTRINGLTASEVDEEAFWKFEEVNGVEIDTYYDYKWIVETEGEEG